MDLIKAILIGSLLIAALLVIPLIIPILIFLLVVGIVWFVIKICKDDDKDFTEQDKPP